MLARKRVRVLLRTCFCRGVVSFAHALNCARGGLSGCPQAAVAYGKWLEEQATRKAAKLRYDGARSDGARSDGARSGGSQMRQPQPQQPHHHQQQAPPAAQGAPGAGTWGPPATGQPQGYPGYPGY